MSDGSEFDRIVALDSAYHLGTYARKPVLFVRGRGMVLVDDTGAEYDDFVAGIGSVNLGHAHPAVAEAVAEQMSRLVQVSNLYQVEHRAELCERLVGLLGGGYKAFLCNSGTEAAEGAIKVARAWGKAAKGSAAVKVVTAERGFHGRTMGALAATGQPGKKEKFEPLPAGFVHVAFDDVAALEAAVGDDTCAVMLEPVQGEGGVYPASHGYLARAAEIAHTHGALLVLDEVQCGLWRTGPAFAHQADGVTPDIVMVAKALANGLPAGAVLVSDEVAVVMEPGDHGSTFGGGPVIAAAALATLRALEADALGAQATRVGEYLRSGLRAISDAYPGAIAEVRGRGQMNAVEFRAPVAGILAERGLASGFVLNAIGTHILRFLPPLLCDTAEVDRLIGTLDVLLADTEVTRIREEAARAADPAASDQLDPREDLT
jgi:predicted acetylornithine/succinylornithine family transaminase